MKKTEEILTEAIGECWHDIKLQNGEKKCTKCGLGGWDMTNFLAWEGFGKLWEWAIKQEWWTEFEGSQGLPRHWVPKQLINPEKFARAIADFLQKKYND
ncbi:MAG: hypothetical protein V3U75_01495 [Methylococcaceae bacterium]